MCKQNTFSPPPPLVAPKNVFAKTYENVIECNKHWQPATANPIQWRTHQARENIMSKIKFIPKWNRQTQRTHSYLYVREK